VFNGDSGYGANGATVTGVEKPAAPTLITWVFPVKVWNAR
jgi:hypothetical protein